MTGPTETGAAMAVRLAEAMIAYDAGDARRIQHFLKVWAFARLIAQGEELGADARRVLEAAALVHDVGIRNAEAKYASSAGPYQELEGPPEAERLLRAAGYAEDDIARVSFLVAHHHTYTCIDGPDYQILVEADFLVNLFEYGSDAQAIRKAYASVFRTETGRRLCRLQFMQALEGEGI